MIELEELYEYACSACLVAKSYVFNARFNPRFNAVINDLKVPEGY